MEYRVVSTDQIPDLAARHPELAAARPDLAAFPFPENPVPPPGDFPYMFYVLDDTRIAGHRRAIPDVAYLDGRAVPWSWSYDSLIEPDYRGRGVGRGLVELQVAEMDRRGIASAAAFSAPAMLRIYHRLGFTVGHAPRMCLVRNAAPFVARHLPGGALQGGAARVANALLAAERALRGLAARAALGAVAPVGDDEFRRLFAGRAAPERGHWASEARWILARKRPGDAQYGVARKGASAPSALLVVRARRPEAADRGPALRRLTLMEYVALDDAPDTPALVAAALERLLLESSADVADIVTAAPALLAALSRRGYRKRGEGMSFAYKLAPGSPVAAPPALGDWHLSHFCSDGFLFP